MRLRTVRPSQGLHWVRRGFVIFARRPLGFMGMFALFLLAALLSMVVPYLGGVLVLMAVPMLTLGFMIGTHDALMGRAPGPRSFFEPLRGHPARRRELIKLGLAYALGTLAIVWLSEAVDGGAFEELQRLLSSDQSKRNEIDALLSDPRLHLGLVLRFGLAMLMAIPFWHAPALIHWDDQGFAQAMFSSTLAFVRALGAFAVYTLAWGAAVIAIGTALGGLLALVDLRAAIGFTVLPLGLLMSSVFYASLYFTFVDSFEAGSRRDDGPATDAEPPAVE